MVVRAGTKPELALDSQGRPHLTYMTEAAPGAVFYASRDGSDSWEIEEVSEGYFYAPMDIVIDGADNIHIAYHDHDFEDLTYAFKLEGQWHVETISHQGHDGWDPSLAIAPDGTVHVIAIDPEQFGTDAGVEWFSRTSGQWRVEGIGSSAIPYEFGTGMAMDAEGRLHAVYHDGDEQLRASGGEISSTPSLKTTPGSSSRWTRKGMWANSLRWHWTAPDIPTSPTWSGLPALREG